MDSGHTRERSTVCSHRRQVRAQLSTSRTGRNVKMRSTATIGTATRRSPASDRRTRRVESVRRAGRWWCWWRRAALERRWERRTAESSRADCVEAKEDWAEATEERREERADSLERRSSDS